jgi:spore germination cell wall hydrolase CwlJ-like protein
VAPGRARLASRRTLDGRLYVTSVGTSTHYHASYVRPNWVREMRKMVCEGVHTFYRPFAWGSGANLPVWTRAAVAAGKDK